MKKTSLPIISITISVLGFLSALVSHTKTIQSILPFPLIVLWLLLLGILLCFVIWFLLTSVRKSAHLVSGLEEKGDFKVSCSQYEKFLQDAGFQFKKEKIAPLDKDDIGGIYVYIAWLK